MWNEIPAKQETRFSSFAGLYTNTSETLQLLLETLCFCIVLLTTERQGSESDGLGDLAKKHCKVLGLSWLQRFLLCLGLLHRQVKKLFACYLRHWSVLFAMYLKHNMEWFAGAAESAKIWGGQCLRPWLFYAFAKSLPYWIWENLGTLVPRFRWPWFLNLVKSEIDFPGCPEFCENLWARG